MIDSYLYWYRVNPQSATKHKPKWNRTDSLLAVERTARYLSEADISFCKEYENYMYARDMWAVAKAFSVSSEKELFKKLSVEYDVKSCMLVTRNDKNSLVRLASRLYLINPFF